VGAKKKTSVGRASQYLIPLWTNATASLPFMKGTKTTSKALLFVISWLKMELGRERCGEMVQGYSVHILVYKCLYINTPSFKDWEEQRRLKVYFSFIIFGIIETRVIYI
jgi:hypothetical protein